LASNISREPKLPFFGRQMGLQNPGNRRSSPLIHKLGRVHRWDPYQRGVIEQIFQKQVPLLVNENLVSAYSGLTKDQGPALYYRYHGDYSQRMTLKLLDRPKFTRQTTHTLIHHPEGFLPWTKNWNYYQGWGHKKGILFNWDNEKKVAFKAGDGRGKGGIAIVDLKGNLWKECWLKDNCHCLAFDGKGFFFRFNLKEKAVGYWDLNTGKLELTKVNYVISQLTSIPSGVVAAIGNRLYRVDRKGKLSPWAKEECPDSYPSCLSSVGDLVVRGTIGGHVGIWCEGKCIYSHRFEKADTIESADLHHFEGRTILSVVTGPPCNAKHWILQIPGI